MCIILTCEKNVRPDNDLLETCFFNNPDGAGIMWVENGRVETSKGFMDVDSLAAAVASVPMDSPLAIHMRIATSGGISVGTCHPFPVCGDLDVLHASDTECSAAVMHNGVIRGEETDEKRGISDTVHFVSHSIRKMWRRDNKLTKKMRRKITELAPGNRFAVLTEDGRMYRLGTGWETVCHGIQASNSTWRYGYNLHGWGAWDDCYALDGCDEGGLYDDVYDLALFKTIDKFCPGCPCLDECKEYGFDCPDLKALATDLANELWLDELGIDYTGSWAKGGAA